MDPLPELAALPDADLVPLVVAGNTRAFAVVMRRHNRKMFRAARSILRDDAEAEDAVQEAYVRAYRALPQFRAEARLSTWLVRIAINEALGRLRADPALASRDDDRACTDRLAEPIASAQQNPEEEAMHNEWCRLVEEAVDRLPADYRAIFMLRAIEGLDVRETAAALGISPTLVKVRLFRARTLLKKLLARSLEPGFEHAFAFDGARCDRIVERVLERIDALRSGISR